MRVSAPIFAVVDAILIWAKTSTGGLAILWRYFAWNNQAIALFAIAMITITSKAEDTGIQGLYLHRDRQG